MIGQLSKKIELKFWDIILPILSNSTILQNIISKCVSLYHNDVLTRQIATAVVISCAGFACGFIIFSITALLA
ncbi:MAG: hypothetical protein NTZ74_07305 [Chloroflexi bacterium]|nr:hypothetical protein [Chloroflexota bacterium]